MYDPIWVGVDGAALSLGAWNVADPRAMPLVTTAVMTVAATSASRQPFTTVDVHPLRSVLSRAAPMTLLTCAFEPVASHTPHPSGSQATDS